MLSAKEIILEYACPLAGVVCANLMFAAPWRDTLEASRKGDLGDLNPTPWTFMAGNTFGWITYSFLRQNLFIFFGNAPGFLLSIWLNMQAVKLQYENFRTKEIRNSIVLALKSSDLTMKSKSFSKVVEAIDGDIEDRTAKSDSVEHETEPRTAMDYAKIVWDVTAQNTPAPANHETMVLAVAFIWLGLVSLISFASSKFSDKTTENIIGIAVNLNLVFFYGAPLSTIFNVLKTRSSSTIHIPTMLTNTANGAFWGAYGFAVMDPFVSVPNSLGACLGGVQIALCLIFPRTKVAAEQIKSGEVESGKVMDQTEVLVQAEDTANP